MTQGLESICSINPENLGGTTPHEYLFKYIDISSVDQGRINWNQVNQYKFSNAPSRARRRIRVGDVLLCTVRPGLQAHARISREEGIAFVASTGFTVLRPNAKDDSSFIFHQIFSNDVAAQLRAKEVGSNYPAVNESDVKLLSIFMPEPAQRQAIGKVLDSIDEAIAQTETIIAKLKQVRTGMLHDLLSYGLDENGQLRDPIAHPEKFKDSPLGLIPEEWDVSRIDNVAEKVQDGTHFSPKSTSGPRRYLTSKNIRFGYLSLVECGWISENEHREIFKRCDVRKGDILITKDGANTGNAAINTLADDFSLLSSVAFIRGKDGILVSEYLLNYLLSPVTQKRIKDLMSGNAITRLTLQKIKDFKIPVPGYEEQIAIAANLEKITANINASETELEGYESIKSGLQDDLLTGRVRVPETIMEGAANP